MTRQMLLCLTCFVCLVTAAKADDYPEVATTVAYNAGYFNAWGEVIGSILPAGDTDPVCDEIHAICRRICADLPPGRTVGSISEVGITPPNYARGVGNPEVYHNQVWRVCRRVKNWGTGTRKTFVMQVVYAPNQESKANCLLGLSAQTTGTTANPDPSTDALCLTSAQTLFGAGFLNISKADSANSSLTMARTDAVSKSIIVEADKSGEINANDQLPKGARRTKTRYQISIPGSGWVECDSGTGQCPVPTATWAKHADGLGTLKNTGKGLLSGRVIVEFVEINAIDLNTLYLVP